MSRQTWETGHYQQHAGFVPTLGQAILDRLAPKAGEEILDLGCGDGVLTKQLMETGAIVKGIDSSESFIETCRARSIDAELMDGEAITYESCFDAVFSNAAMHWMKNPDAVANGVFRALRPGGRFVSEMGGFGNVGAIRAMFHVLLDQRGIDPMLHDPWYFPSPAAQTQVLERAGFNVVWTALVPRPTPLPTDMVGWLSTFGQSFAAALDSKDRPGLYEDVAKRLETILHDPATGTWYADYVRLRFEAHRPV